MEFQSLKEPDVEAIASTSIWYCDTRQRSVMHRCNRRWATYKPLLYEPESDKLNLIYWLTGVCSYWLQVPTTALRCSLTPVIILVFFVFLSSVARANLHHQHLSRLLSVTDCRYENKSLPLILFPSIFSKSEAHKFQTQRQAQSFSSLTFTASHTGICKRACVVHSNSSVRTGKSCQIQTSVCYSVCLILQVSLI